MIDDKDADRFRMLANEVGISYSRKYPGIEREDIAQAALAALLDNKNVATKGNGWITAVLTRAARQYCNKERSDYMYYSSQYVYSAKDVRAVLEVAYTSGYDSHSTPKVGDKDEVLDASSVVISVFDLTTAIKKLNKESRLLLDKKHTGYELTGSESRKYYRTIDALVGFLNRHLNSKERVREHAGPGSRKTINNATALAMVSNNDQGDFDTFNDAVDVQRVQNKLHPVNVRSRHVVNSPWRNNA